MFRKVLALIATLVFLGAASLVAQEQEVTRDEIIAADVYKVIENHVFYSIFDIVKFEVKDQAVLLEGYVTEPYKKTAFEDAVKKHVPAVTNITNKIEVLPPSTFDDELRYVMAIKIYNDNRLLPYAISGIPKPIHIIVRNGHVTLEGKVQNDMEKRIIESHARETQGVVSVTDNLQVE
jgi:osmotically-inducible protein OsmY